MKLLVFNDIFISKGLLGKTKSEFAFSSLVWNDYGEN
jgi:hypothetical protein